MCHRFVSTVLNCSLFPPTDFSISVNVIAIHSVDLGQNQGIIFNSDLFFTRNIQFISTCFLFYFNSYPECDTSALCTANVQSVTPVSGLDSCTGLLSGLSLPLLFIFHKFSTQDLQESLNTLSLTMPLSFAKPSEPH